MLLLGPAGEKLKGTEVHCRAGRGEGGLLLRVALGPGTTAAQTQPGHLALCGPPAVLALEAGPEGALGTVLHCAATSPGAHMENRFWTSGVSSR